jgi:Uma2 family endonuclease
MSSRYSAAVVYADIPLTLAVRQGLAAAFGVPVEEKVEESAYRVSDVVVRIAPQWRTDRENRTQIAASHALKP